MQLAGQIYRDEGGEYCGPRTKAQKSMEKWTDEDWTTATGKKACKTVDGKTVCDRYLPKKAWGKLSKGEREATRRKKKEADSQWVPNTAKASTARKEEIAVRNQNVTDRMNEMLEAVTSAKGEKANKEYWKRYNRIEQDLKQLQKMLDSHGKQQRKNPSNWGFVGDLGYLQKEIEDLLDSFSVN